MRLYLTVCAVMCSMADGQLILQKRITSDLPLNQVLEKADAVVVGTLQSTVAPGKLVSATVRVERSLKGSLQPSENIFLDVEISTRGALIPASFTGVWFLSGEPRHWSALPLVNASAHEFEDFYLRLPEWRQDERSGIPENASPTEKLAAEIATVLQHGDVGGAVNRRFLFNSIVSLASGISSSSTHTSIYRALADSSSLEQRSVGIGGLIGMENAALNREGISRLAADRDVRITPSPASSSLSNALCNARVLDPESITILGTTILRDSEPRMAHCAAVVLWAVHTRESLPYLASLLDHPDQEMRYAGVIGLATFANNLPVHNPKSSTASMDWLTPLPGKAPYATQETREHFAARDVFENQESKYLEFWKHWWVEHRVELSAN